MTVAHVMGLPLEESVLQLGSAGAAVVTAIVVAGRTTFGRLRGRTTRHGSREGKT
jgi:hypothetical protein